MTNFYNDREKKLVKFLRQYHGKAPENIPDFEDRLINLIESTPQAYIKKRRNHNSIIWGLPTAIAAGLLLSWGSHLWQQSITQTYELEEFVVNSWNGVLMDTSFNNDLYENNTDWSVLTEPNYEYSYTSNSSNK